MLSPSPSGQHDHLPAAGWLVPDEEQQGLRRYVQTVRERWKLIAITTAVTLLAAVVYVAAADKRYEAQADLLVTPVPGSNDALAGTAGLIRESNDPTRDVQTAARLVTTIDVARRASVKLDTKRRARSLLADGAAATGLRLDELAGHRVAEHPLDDAALAGVTTRQDDDGVAPTDLGHLWLSLELRHQRTSGARDTIFM